MRIQIRAELALTQKPGNIIRSLLISRLIQAADQISRISFIVIYHNTPAVDPDRSSLFVNPSVMKIMCFFLSCGHFGKVLHKHLTVFLIDCRQRIIQKSAGYHKAIHRSLRKLQFTILYVKYIEEIVHALRNSFHQFSRCHFFK